MSRDRVSRRGNLSWALGFVYNRPVTIDQNLNYLLTQRHSYQLDAWIMGKMRYDPSDEQAGRFMSRECREVIDVARLHVRNMQLSVQQRRYYAHVIRVATGILAGANQSFIRVERHARMEENRNRRVAVQARYNTDAAYRRREGHRQISEAVHAHLAGGADPVFD